MIFGVGLGKLTDLHNQVCVVTETSKGSSHVSATSDTR